MMNTGPLKVLQIEDSPGDVRLVRELLREAAPGETELEVAGRLDEGIEKLRTGAYDLVLLDLALPDSQGMETFERLRTEVPRATVVILSGIGDEETAIKAMRRGAQDYLVKGEDTPRSFLRALRYAVERKRFKGALRDERDLLRSIINSLPDEIYVKDAAGRFKRANSATARFFGLETPEDLIGKTDFDFFPRELAQQFFDEEQRILGSGQALVNREACVTVTDGPRRWILTTKVPLRNHAGCQATVGINRDVTDIKEAEEKLRTSNEELANNQAELEKAVAELKKAHQDLRETQMQLIEVEKLQTVGRLAAGVAHEVKNPMAVALRGIEYLSRTPLGSQDPACGVVLQDMHEAIRRAERVIRGLLDFAAPRKLDLARQDINRMLDDALLLLKHEIVKHKVSVETAFDPLLPPCRLDSHKAQEVFINVYENAIHAMPDGGTLSVRTFQKTVTGVGTNIGDRTTYGFEMGDTLVGIEILDTGTGIPEDRLHKIFEPFFTTKPAGQGSGLGLSISKTIVALHGGTIEIFNRPAGGARVVILFPPADTAVAPESQPA